MKSSLVDRCIKRAKRYKGYCIFVIIILWMYLTGYLVSLSADEVDVMSDASQAFRVLFLGFTAICFVVFFILSVFIQ